MSYRAFFERLRNSGHCGGRPFLILRLISDANMSCLDFFQNFLRIFGIVRSAP